MFVIVENNQNVILGPMPWRKLFFQNILLDECDAIVDLPQTNDGVFIVNENYKIMPAKYVEVEYNKRTQQLNGPFWEFSENEATGTFLPVSRNVDSVKSELKSLVAEKRWEKEVGGVKLSLYGNEYTIDTSRDGRNIFLQAAQLGADNNSWKFPEGWVVLSNADLQTIVTTIFTHVQKCFSDEANRISEIESKQSVEELSSLYDVYELGV